MLLVNFWGYVGVWGFFLDDSLVGGVWYCGGIPVIWRGFLVGFLLLDDYLDWLY